MNASTPAPPARFDLRLRLFAVSIVWIIAGLLGAQLTLTHVLDNAAIARLDASASLAAVAVRSAGAVDATRVQTLLCDLAREARTRFTLVASNGTVVADSALSSTQLQAIENHGTRPEVRDAMHKGRGFARRESDTLGAPFYYVAVRLYDVRRQPWVLRAAVSPDVLGSARATAWRLVAIAGVLALLAAAGMSSLAVMLAARPVRALTERARAMVHDLNVRTGITSRDDVGALASALDELADNLTRSLATLGRDRDRLGAILEGMVEGVLVTDANGAIALANRAVRELFLVERDVLGRAPIEALRSAEMREVFDEAARTHATVTREFSVAGVRPRQLMVRVSSLEGADAGAVAVVSDVTELRRLETVRRDFVANVSHELRTPVAAVRAAAETLLLGAVEHADTAREFVGIVDRHAERLHSLVEDLLELSRLEAREFALSLEALDARQVIDRAIELMTLAAQARNTTLTVEVAPGVGPLLGDRRGVEHVLTNLIDNAIKYAPPRSSVALRALPWGEGIRITVEDNGPGIEARHLPRIFERFYRVDTSRSRALGGTGLGLAIVKHMSEAMGAMVSVESTVGKGTRFHVDLQSARLSIDERPSTG